MTQQPITRLVLYVKADPSFSRPFPLYPDSHPEELAQAVSELLSECHAAIYPRGFQGLRASAVGLRPNELGLRKLRDLQALLAQPAPSTQPPYAAFNDLMQRQAQESLDEMFGPATRTHAQLGPFLPMLRSTFALMVKSVAPGAHGVRLLPPRNASLEPGIVILMPEGELRGESLAYNDKRALQSLVMSMQACGFGIQHLYGPREDTLYFE